MVDYTKLQATANRLIEENGRAISLVRLSQTPADSNKPWQGPADDEEEFEEVYGCFVPPNTVRQFGITSLGEGTEVQDLVKHSEQIIITAQGDLDVRSYSEILDRDERWGIVGIQVLRPGNTTLLSFIGVRR